MNVCKADTHTHTFVVCTLIINGGIQGDQIRGEWWSQKDCEATVRTCAIGMVFKTLVMKK